MYLAGIVIGIVVLKYVADFVRDKTTRQQIAKERKQGRSNKHESDYEGLNFSDESGDDESGLVGDSIELTTFDKRQKQITVRSNLQSFNSAADSDSDEEISGYVQQDAPMTPAENQP